MVQFESPSEPAKKTRIVERTYLDVETGEQRLMRHEEPINKRPPRATEPFVMAFPTGLRKVLELDLSGNDLRVLLALTSMMAYIDSFRVSTNEIAQIVGTNPTSVSRSLRRLTDAGVIDRHPNRRVLLNPEYFWCGPMQARTDALTAPKADAV